jgi:hypothetical protein
LPISTRERVGGAGVDSSVGRLSSSVAAALLLTPAIPARGTKSPATRTPASTLTMTNITSEYATLPARLGLNGMADRVREDFCHTEFLTAARVRVGSGEGQRLSQQVPGTNVRVEVTNAQRFNLSL